MNFKKLLLSLFLLSLFIIPINTFAYSSSVIVGGENIGIKVNNKYISIQGFYKVGDTYIGSEAGLKVGDYITKINDINVSSINEMINAINESNDKSNIKITFLRNNKEDLTFLSLTLDENNVYKTGLYVKDSITGIGTLTYIDPATNIFGALGHEILDKNTSLKVEIKNGSIFESSVESITKSENGTPGEKNARFSSTNIFGTITKNEDTGIFGKYISEFPSKETVEVGDLESIKLDTAIIRTVINQEEKQDFKIKILEVDKMSDTKNILFEITDEELLKLTGGVVAGMSGSPILQNGKIIGAVTHVVVNSPEKGYGVGIENMLERGEK